MNSMKHASELKLIDLLSLRPGSLLTMHAIKGEVECIQPAALPRHPKWQQEVSSACFPDGDAQKIHNFSKLLDISVHTQIIIRYPDQNLVELLRMEPKSWHTLLARVGHPVVVMVNSRPVAEGEIVDTNEQRGIRITKVTGKFC